MARGLDVAAIPPKQRYNHSSVVVRSDHGLRGDAGQLLVKVGTDGRVMGAQRMQWELADPNDDVQVGEETRGEESSPSPQATVSKSSTDQTPP